MVLTIKKRLSALWNTLGPGFITGASDDDPSGIATYAQTGAQFGLAQLWLSIFSLPFTILIQEMCGRIGMVTGSGLSRIIKTHYSKTALYVCVGLLVLANTINIGANLGAMAEASQLLVPVPFMTLLAIFTISTVVLQVFVDYRLYVRFLKYLTLTLLAYIAVAFMVQLDWNAVILGLTRPRLQWSEQYLFNVVAVLGTTLSPYLFFWQTSEEVEEAVLKRKIKDMGRLIKSVTGSEVYHMRLDTIIGMTFSNMIMFFIILSAASTLYPAGIHTIETAPQAAEALRPIAGPLTSVIFTLGILGAGMLSVPVLAGSASYAVAELFGWKEGLFKKAGKAPAFYGTIAGACAIGFLINFTGIKPFTLLYYTAVLNGLCSPIILFFILRIANNRAIMGRHTNSLLSNLFGYTITFIMSVAGGLLLLQLLW